MGALLICDRLTIKYDNHVAVEDISFSVEKGDYFCILGENGSGKSTLVKGLLGLVTPSAGQIIWEGIEKNQIGYLPQQTNIQRDFPASVWEVVLSGTLNNLESKLFYSKRQKQKAKANLEKLNIEKIKYKSYRELSGGQQQRVLLARALCAGSKILILDEPTAGLDPVAAKSLYKVIKQINMQDGITVIMISHDINSAVKYSTHILHMKTKNIFFGLTEEYKQSPIYKLFTGGEQYA